MSDGPRDGGPSDWIEEETEGLPHRGKHGRRRSGSIRQLISRLQRPERTLARPEAAPLGGLVVSVSRGACTVDRDGELLVCRLLPHLAELQRTDLAAGDEVRLEAAPGESPVVTSVLPRRSVLSRPDPRSPEIERVVVANVDVVVIVASLRAPPLRTGLIDRYLVAVARGGAAPCLAVNKADLADPERARDPELAALAPYADLDLPVVLCSAATGEGLVELASRLSGRTAALVGHSGVGKSSLLNALDPALELATAETSPGRGIGRHTTRQATVYRLADGTRIIDTPGIRELGLWKIGRSELAAYFDDFATLALSCRYADCTHSHEPRCAVRDAAASGRIAPARFAAYLRMLESLEAGAP